MKEVKNENGRSMIEMLGVLAIIGVLSVGGIAGYSKAMYRYRLNKTIEEITYSAGAVRSFFAPQKSYAGLYRESYMSGGNLYRKAKLVQEDMFGEYFSGSNFLPSGVANPFGGYFAIESTPKINSSDCLNDPICSTQAFYVELNYLSPETCIDLITQDWSDVGVSMIYVRNGANPTTTLRNARIIPPVSIDNAVKICEVPASNTTGVIISFYFDLDAELKGYKTYIDNTRAALEAL